MKDGIVGADHEFHDKDFALGWAERFVPTPERLRLFNIILSELQRRIPGNGRVLELGIGPGYLADYVLGSMPDITYHGIDFSEPMLEIASGRLKANSSRVTYSQVDLVKDSWEQLIPGPFHAVISTWALHDLGNPNNVELVYAKSLQALGAGGILLNGDFIKPDGAAHEFEAGRFPVVTHLQMLAKVGFSSADCLALLEEELVSPTPAQNYACLRAVK